MDKWSNSSERLNLLPPYIFSELSKVKDQAEKQGKKILSLAIGDPDLPTPKVLVEKMREAILKPQNHVYSSYEGSLEFRTSISRWVKRRFNVNLDPQKEIISLIGSKEGIAHFPLAFVNPGDVCLYPDPAFPMYATTIAFAGGTAIPVPLKAENDFLPDLVELEALIRKHQPKYVLVNYPHNPTAATCPLSTYSDLVALAKKYHFIIGSDNAYSETYFDPKDRPASILEVSGAKEVAIEFHSLSKTFHMTGWRLGFAIGNEDLVQGLLRIKTNIDSGPLLSVQEVGAYALDHAEDFIEPHRNIYAGRKEIMKNALRDTSYEFRDPKATFYMWIRVPGTSNSLSFATRLIEDQGLIVTPGIGFGKSGEGFFRLSLTASNLDIEEAASRLRKFLSR